MIQEHRIKSKDGLELFSIYQHPTFVKPNSPTVFWLHGAFEHCLRYKYVINRFAENGFASVAFDQRGHGQSKGKKMSIQSFADYSNDLICIYDYYRSKIEGDAFLIGHSMGGLVAVRFFQEHPHLLPFKACVLSAPFMGLKAEVPAWKKFLSGLVVKISPEFSLPTELDVNMLSRDPLVGKEYAKDPLVSKFTTAIWFEETMKSCQQALLKARQCNIPLLLMQAGEDRIADNDASKKFFERMVFADKKLITWDGAFHELFNEINKDEIIDCVLGYLIEKTAK